ncbi:MAG: hypothetical protein J5737_07515 [Bacteroidales bacterium]|nr:hypothetical protein [Bacteroidales bacterium]
MNKRAKYAAGAASICLMLAGLILLHGCVAKAGSRKLCQSLDVRIKGDLEFVTADDIQGYLDKRYGCYIGAPLDSIDLGHIESLLKEKNVVKECEAWVTRDGVLHVSVGQREPALRFDRGTGGFYIDREGFVIPLHRSYTAPVPVVEGNIPPLEKGESAEWGTSVLGLVDYIQSSKTWQDKVDKISVNASGDLEVRLKDGSERFILGAPDSPKVKFDKIQKYFSYIVPEKGEGYYKSVNLKYNKQIICRKDI